MPARGLTYECIRQAALSTGLDDVGVVTAQRWDGDALFMDEWVAQGLHGNMSYFERNQAKRYDIRELVPDARAVVVALLTYEHSGHDYHRTLKSLLYRMRQRILDEGDWDENDIFSAGHQHVFCDSAPVLERRMAVAAGLGFIGKNHQLIHPRLGSRVHIGELVLQADVQDAPYVQVMKYATGCKDCQQCIAACPGQALGREEWDARRCVAYVTHKCEICQTVCPYNEKLI